MVEQTDGWRKTVSEISKSSYLRTGSQMVRRSVTHCTDQPVGLKLVLTDGWKDGCVEKMEQLMTG